MVDERDILLVGVFFLFLVDVDDIEDDSIDSEEHVLFWERFRSTFLLFLFLGWGGVDDGPLLLCSSITIIFVFLRFGVDTDLVRGISKVAALIFMFLSNIVDL